jgi:hypothetical protein
MLRERVYCDTCGSAVGFRSAAETEVVLFCEECSGEACARCGTYVPVEELRLMPCGQYYCESCTDAAFTPSEVLLRLSAVIGESEYQVGRRLVWDPNPRLELTFHGLKMLVGVERAPDSGEEEEDE